MLVHKQLLLMQAAKLRAQSTEHRAQSTEHRAQSTEHRAQSTEHRAQSTEHRAQSTEHRAHRAQSTEHRAQRTTHKAPAIALQCSMQQDKQHSSFHEVPGLATVCSCATIKLGDLEKCKRLASLLEPWQSWSVRISRPWPSLYSGCLASLYRAFTPLPCTTRQTSSGQCSSTTLLAMANEVIAMSLRT